MIVGVPTIPLFGFGLLFVTLGFFIRKAGRKSAIKKIAALEKGQPCEGKIFDVGFDRTQTVNGRNPYLVNFSFVHQGTERTGSTIAWNDQCRLFKSGQEVWVVYDAESDASSLWPPLI